MSYGLSLKIFDIPFTVCRLTDAAVLNLSQPYTFYARTAEEISLVCPTACVPAEVEAREDGWRAFCINGILDFSLIGILSGISTVLADNGIGIFAVSTYNTDYIFVKEPQLPCAIEALEAAGYTMHQ